MNIEFKIGGKKVSQDELNKMNEQPINDSEDLKDLNMGLSALKRIKEMKGQKMPEFLEKQHESIKKDLGETGVTEKSDDARELEASLDLLENVKRRKRGEPIKDINLDGLSEEYKKDFLEAQESLKATTKDQEKNQEESDQKKEKMKICEKCGGPGLLEDSFCRTCGNKFEKEEEKILCSKCGSKIDADSRFCGKCGEKVVKIDENHADGNEGYSIKNDSETVLRVSEKERTLEINMTRKALLDYLDKIPGIQGSLKFYTSEELKKDVTEVLDKLKEFDITKDKEKTAKILQKITNQGSIKLRDKVHEIALLEKIQRG